MIDLTDGEIDAICDGLRQNAAKALWKDGKTVTYRYHPVGQKPFVLGTDKNAAIRQVLDINGATPPQLNLNFLWEACRDSPEWKSLSGNTQESYFQSSKPLLHVFGQVHPTGITPTNCARYLRVERKAAPVRANREMALLSQPDEPCRRAR